MNVFLIVLLVAIGLLFIYEAFMLVRAIIKRHKNKQAPQCTRKPLDKLSNNQRKE